MKRRDFLMLAAATASCRSARRNELVHVLPTVSHNRLLVKTSFRDPLRDAPELDVSGTRVTGRRTDTQGYFWAFDASGLEAGRRHELTLHADGRMLDEPWHISTHPPPDSEPERVRMLVYTCAGGHPVFERWVPVEIRRRMFRRALDFEPDIVVANGDHVYWDLEVGETAKFMGSSPVAIEKVGKLERGSSNENIFKEIVGPQVSDLYRTFFRSTPVYFMRDDHDYFENDYYLEGDDGKVEVTMPPDPFHLDLARTTQRMYYPEFLPGEPRGLNESFGTIRYGRLLEALCYDCKGFMSLEGDDATVVPPEVEGWLRRRMSGSDARQVINIPSNPPGYTAGKWAEWYPDVLESRGKLTTEVEKPGWQPGWFEQHNRLLTAASSMKRIPLFLSGDIHSHAETKILGSGPADFTENPVISVVTGTPSAGETGWPSTGIRQTRALPPIDLEVEEGLPALEENGFNLVDVEKDRITVRFYRWRAGVDAPEVIDTLEPFRTSVFERQA